MAEHAPSEWAELPAEQLAGRVVVGIETDRRPWVAALVAAGYQVYAINPQSAARHRQRHSTSGAKSDPGDAHVLAEIVRLDRNAAIEAFDDLAAADALALLGRAPDPARAGKLTRAQLVAALRAAGRHHVEAKADALLAVLRAPSLRQPDVLQAAYAAVVTGQVGLIVALNKQIKDLQVVVAEHLGRHPAAEIYLSQPGLAAMLGARVLGEFGDDAGRFADARGRKNYSGQSPITRASGKKTVVLARYATNHRLGDALHKQAYAALSGSPGARASYDNLRARKIGHHAALRQVANRLVGILRGCLKTGTLYDENTAWPHHLKAVEIRAAA